MPDTDGKTSHVMVRFTPELHEQVKAFAEANDLSMAQVIRAAVRKYLKAPSLEEVQPASTRGPCTCRQFTRGFGETSMSIDPRCPQHAVVVG